MIKPRTQVDAMTGKATVEIHYDPPEAAKLFKMVDQGDDNGERFAVGAVVRLKSGGTFMTVVESTGPDCACFAWIGGKLTTFDLPAAALTTEPEEMRI